MGFWYSEEQERKVKEVSKEWVKKQRSVSVRSNLEDASARGCAACPLDKEKLYHGKMPPTGAKRPKVYILGEAPGKDEDEKGEQFVGKAGRTLRAHLPKKYLDSIRWNNTIRCHPPGDRTPEALEIACCRSLQEQDIETSRPEAIFGFGAVPLKWVLRRSDVTVTPWRGRRLPVQFGKHRCWYYPMLHPSYVNRVQEDKARGGDEIERVFRRDIEKALQEVFEEGLPEPWIEQKNDRAEGVECLLKPDLRKLESWLAEASGWEECGVDFETNMLRPYSKQRRILSISVSNYEKTFAFSYRHPECDWADEIRELVRAFFTSKGRKWAHNANFEMEWELAEFGEETLRSTPWGDTMAQAYILDEREGAKGLDDLTLLHLGFNVKAESTVNVKDLQNEPLNKVLQYNALDAKYCFALSVVQGDLLDRSELQAVYADQVQRKAPLVLMQALGLVPNVKALEHLKADYGRKEQAALKKIASHPDVVAWVKAGNKFLASSPKDWVPFLKHHFPERGVSDAQEETLSALHYAPATAEVERRRAHKQLSTYLLPYMPGGSAVHEDGLVHTRYNDCLTTTRRLSSEDPNSQNIPRRKSPEVRAIICAPRGMWMVKADYGQIEARVIAMASRDPTLVQETREGQDIHGVWTDRLGKKLKKKVSEKQARKEYRDKIKNGWTFPLFFGSSATSVAQNLESKQGITWDIYKEHPSALPWFRDEVRAFWDKYGRVKEWQEERSSFYKQFGYVETLTGFRRHAPLSWNELINQPIQGTASDIVVDGMNRLSAMSWEEDKPELHPRMNVHDELCFYISDANLDEYVEIIGAEMARTNFTFVNVPLSVEVSVGRDWYEMDEIATFIGEDWKRHEKKASIR